MSTWKRSVGFLKRTHMDGIGRFLDLAMAITYICLKAFSQSQPFLYVDRPIYHDHPQDNAADDTHLINPTHVSRQISREIEMEGGANGWRSSNRSGEETQKEDGTQSSRNPTAWESTTSNAKTFCCLKMRIHSPLFCPKPTLG